MITERGWDPEPKRMTAEDWNEAQEALNRAAKVREAIQTMYEHSGVKLSEDPLAANPLLQDIITTEEAIVDVMELCEYCGPVTAVAVLQALQNRYGSLLNDSKNSNPD